ncbi:MAG: hypothetical protein V1753_03600 [Pseudomonadota bacterium]
MQQGLQDGLQQGKLQEAKVVILEILESRFDVLPPSILRTVEAISDLAILKLKFLKQNKYNQLISKNIFEI